MTDSAAPAKLRFAPGVGTLVDPDRWCSHYTSLATALEYILPSNTLRLSPLSAVNDPKESGISGWMGGSVPVPPEKVQAYIAMESELDQLCRRHVKVLCTSLDSNDHPQGLNRTHFKPRMWAQYGERGRGMCIVLDRHRLAAQFPPSSTAAPIIAPVTYTDDAHTMVIPSLAEADLGLPALELARRRYETHHDRLVFKKHRDWASEAELRLACYAEDAAHHYLQLGDAIAALVLGPEFPVAYRPLVKAEATRRDVPALRLRWNASSVAYERWA